ncbi:MAG TPA: class I SAM-dependent rRNA methyltransferase [Acidobacteriota bacterium]|nr:class I SAM-dependent rRNA methyltransferase [Acidobacteriota bacterium]
MTQDLASVVISDRAKKRLKSKHPWIFSNEIETKPQVQPGEWVKVQDRSGLAIALGYYNPHTLIAVRILSYRFDFDLRTRIKKALEERKRAYSDDVYRLVYSESDGLPGLVVDRYGQTLVVQLLTAGIERMKNDVLSILSELVQPDRILLRNDSAYRELEGLPLHTDWALGEPIEKEILEIDGLRFALSYASGQKTGFFLDQRENRQRLAHYAGGQTMLDVFSYSGAWAMYAAKAGYSQITAIDSSSEALAAVQENANLNGFSVNTLQADVFEFLRSQYAKPDRYDCIVLDPPAFCKSKRNLAQAVKGYREINVRAMKLLSKNGVLFTCSCSQPLTPDLFEGVLRQAAADSGRTFHFREMRFQPPDHPVLLHFPESHYLKCAVLEL